MDNELQIIWLLAIGLSFAAVFGYIAQLAKQSPILGYLLAGYIIGPNSPGYVANLDIAEQLANIGVTLLMFAVGLSLSWQDLLAVKKLALPGALTLSTLSILAGTFFSAYLGESLTAGFVIGLAICVASTVVIVRVLTDQNLIDTRQGHIVLGWTIVEDLISVLGLLILPSLNFQGSDSEPTNSFLLIQVLITVGKIGLLFSFVYFLGGRIVEMILQQIARTRSHELFTLVILSVVFLVALGSSYVFGISIALGAFIAGTIVGSTDMNHQASANALPMRDAFSVIFFLSVGMLFNPMSVMNNMPLLIGILCILLVFRPVMAFLIIRLAQYPIPVALTAALSISQIGEYSFILAEEGTKLGILGSNVHDIIVACAFVTIGLNPFLFQIFGRYCKHHVPMKKMVKGDIPGLDIEWEDNSNLIKSVIIGFGPVGQQATKFLRSKGADVVVVDRNIDTIALLKGEKIRTLYGDGANLHILKEAMLESTNLLIVTTPDFATTYSIIQSAKKLNPEIKIIARVHYKIDEKRLIEGHIKILCDEEVASEKIITLIQEELQLSKT